MYTQHRYCNIKMLILNRNPNQDWRSKLCRPVWQVMVWTIYIYIDIDFILAGKGDSMCGTFNNHFEMSNNMNETLWFIVIEHLKSNPSVGQPIVMTWQIGTFWGSLAIFISPVAISGCYSFLGQIEKWDVFFACGF